MSLKINTWGYSTINFFAPMSRYASDGGGPLKASQEFKQMVKALHGAGIEVNYIFLQCSCYCSFETIYLFFLYRSFWMLSIIILMKLMTLTLIPLHFVA